jgi:hypothetical protein
MDRLDFSSYVKGQNPQAQSILAQNDSDLMQTGLPAIIPAGLKPIPVCLHGRHHSEVAGTTTLASVRIIASVLRKSNAATHESE